MTWRDKLEIGLKDDAPFRRDNLPDFQQTSGGPETQPGDPTRSPEEPGARHDAEVASVVAPPTEDAVDDVTRTGNGVRDHVADAVARGAHQVESFAKSVKSA